MTLRVTPRTIHAYPGWANKHINPYNAVLYDAMTAIGWHVVDPTTRESFFGRPDVIHVHWPQDRVNQPFWTSARRVMRFIASLAVQRARGARIVWTIHNVISHQPRRPRMERWFMVLFTRLLSGHITLNSTTREEAVAQYPVLARLPHALIPHVLYGDSYPASPGQAAAKAHFGLPGNQPVIGFVGDLRAYKGLGKVMTAIVGSEAEAITIFIAGRFTDPVFAGEVRSAICTAIARGWRVVLREGRLDDGDLVAALDACDLLLLPYTNDSNSGLAVLAAERAVPMLLADNNAFRKMAEEADNGHISIAAEDFSAEEMIAKVSEVQSKRVSPAAPFLDARAPMVVARRTSDFFGVLMKRCS